MATDFHWPLFTACRRVIHEFPQCRRLEELEERIRRVTAFLSEDFTIRTAGFEMSLADKRVIEGTGNAFHKATMTVIDIRLCNREYTIETHGEETLSCNPVTPTIGWFGFSDWERGIDIVVTDPSPQNLPSVPE